MQKKFLTRKSSYHYELPSKLIAQHPKDERSSSNLLYLERNSGKITHHKFDEISSFLQKGDLLVLNKTKVIPARLIGEKTTGARCEIFLLEKITEEIWKCLVKPGKKLKPNSEVILSEKFRAKILDYAEEGTRLVKFFWNGDFWENLDKYGKMPLPPYIKREAKAKDKETYQTVYASEKGSVAAPTAGLHFTRSLLEKLQKQGIDLAEVVLDVSLGTFRPVQKVDIRQHKMHSEHCRISYKNAMKINQAIDEKRRIIAVGTTTTRTLESFAKNKKVESGQKWTNLFLYPGKKFQIINGLLTNFHMPESTLLMLVSAFAGYENIMNAYKIAVKKRYRFFSYGDAMLIL